MKIRQYTDARTVKQKWIEQAEELRHTFPSFDWEESLQYADFCLALLKGCSVYEAYMIKLYNSSSPVAKEVIKTLSANDNELTQLTSLMEQTFTQK